MESIPDLLNEVRKGNPPAEMLLCRLLEKHCFPAVKNYILASGGAEDTARSLFNYACTVLWEKIVAGRFTLDLLSSKPYVEQLCAFVMAVARNQFHHLIREQRHLLYQPGEQFAGLPDEEELPEIHENLYRLAWQETQELGEPCRSRLADRFGRKLSYAETGRRHQPPLDPKTARNAVVACVLALLSRLHDLLKKNEAQTLLEDIALASLNVMPEPCKSLLGKFYHPTNKRSMTDIAGEFGYKTEHVARTAKYECMKELQLSIGEKLLGNTQTNTA